MISFTQQELQYDERCHVTNPEWNMTMEKIGPHWCALCCGKILKRFSNKELCRLYLYDTASEEVKNIAEKSGTSTRDLIRQWRREKRANETQKTS